MLIGHGFERILQQFTGKTQLVGFFLVELVQVKRLVLTLQLLLHLSVLCYTVRVDYLVIEVNLHDFVEERRHLIDGIGAYGIDTRVGQVFELCGKLLEGISLRIAARVDFEKAVGVLFHGIDGLQFAIRSLF